MRRGKIGGVLDRLHPLGNHVGGLGGAIPDAQHDERIGDALAEAETLPDTAKAEMTDWLAAAQSRADALAALETLSATQNGQ